MIPKEPHQYAHLHQYKLKNMVDVSLDELRAIDDKHCNWLAENKAIPAQDITVGNAIQCHKPPHLRDLALKIYEKMKEVIHPDLVLTYWFSTVYGAGDFLNPHSDRPCCSISVSYNVNQIGDDWPIYVWDWPRKEFLAFNTDPGDGVIYTGFNHHYRNQYHGYHYHQLFVHTVLPNTEEHDCEDTQNTIRMPCSITSENGMIIFDPVTGEEHKG